jgi:ribokinase
MIFLSRFSSGLIISEYNWSEKRSYTLFRRLILAGKIVVVGSFVYDMVVWLPYLPRNGETLLASEFKMFAGGKGFNQAVSARRCGVQVSMIGKVGADQFGSAFLDIMQREGIDHSFVIQDSTTTTSLGIPMINPDGDNSIIGIPRANTLMTPAEVMAAKEFITQHHLLMLQLEIPLEASLEAAQIASHVGMTVIFNPAPANHSLLSMLPRDDCGEPLIDWFIPNEVEAEMLSGLTVMNPDEAITSGKFILSKGVKKGVVITMGSKGAVAVTPDDQYYIPAFPVTPVDPTGAGDAFCGSFAAALSEGKPVEQALRFANAAGALAVTKAGAEPSLPRREKIDAFLHEHM